MAVYSSNTLFTCYFDSYIFFLLDGSRKLVHGVFDRTQTVEKYLKIKFIVFSYVSPETIELKYAFMRISIIIT